MKVSSGLLSPPLKVMGVICFQFWNLKRKSNAAAVTTPFAIIWASQDQKEAFHLRANPVNSCLCAAARCVMRIKRPEDTFMRALCWQFSRFGSAKARFGLKKAGISGTCVCEEMLFQIFLVQALTSLLNQPLSRRCPGFSWCSVPLYDQIVASNFSPGAE